MNTITRLYNLLHTGNPGDVAYYKSCCPPGTHVLELGCGKGRIGASLQQQGCIVTGLDYDENMLEAFKQFTGDLSPTPAVHLADMRTFSLNCLFDRIIIPFNGLLCMLSPDDVLKVFQQVASHLKPDGKLIFDIYYVPSDFENDEIEDDFYIDTTVIDDNGTSIEVYEKTLTGDDPQRFDTSYIFVTGAHTPLEEQIEHTIEQRCLYFHQVEQLLNDARLSITAVHVNFDILTTRNDITDDTQQIAIHAAHGQRPA